MVRKSRGRPRGDFPQHLTLAIILGISVILHAWNLLATPWFFSDEGTYIYRAMYLQDRGLAYPTGLSPGFTFVYGHPPGGWALLAVIFTLFGPLVPILGESATAYIVLARGTAVGLTTLDALLLYFIGRRAANRWVGLAGATLMAVAPLSTTWGREALLDNFMAFWLLLSLYLGLRGRAHPSPSNPVLSGVAMGLSVLSKLPAAFMIPIPLLAFLLKVPRTRPTTSIRASRRLRNILLWSVALAGVALLWPLYAVMHGETSRLVDGLEWFVSRDEGYTFLELMGQAVRRDPILVGIGVAGIGYGLARFRSGRFIFALPALAYLGYLWWVRVRWAYYVAPLAPFLALSAGLPLGDFVKAVLGHLRPHTLARVLPSLLVALIIALPAFQAWSLDQRTDNDAGLAAAAWVIQRAQPFSMVLANAIYQGSIQRARPDLWVLYWIDDDFGVITNTFLKGAPPPLVAIDSPQGRVDIGPAMDSSTFLELPGGHYTITISYARGSQETINLTLDADAAVVPRPPPRYVPQVLRRSAPGPTYRLQVLDPLAMRIYFISDNTTCCAGWAGGLFNALLAIEGTKIFEGSSKDSTFNLTLSPGLYALTLASSRGTWRWIIPLDGSPKVELVPGRDVLTAAESPVSASPPAPVALAFRDPQGTSIPWGWVQVKKLNDLVRFPGPYGDAGVVFVDGVRALQTTGSGGRGLSQPGRSMGSPAGFIQSRPRMECPGCGLPTEAHSVAAFPGLPGCYGSFK